MSRTALRDYEPRVLNHCHHLVSLLASRCSSTSALDVTPYFKNWGLDIIGDLGFGKQFGMLDSDGTSQQALYRLSKAKAFQVLFSTVPWLFTLLGQTVPFVRSERKKWDQYCLSMLMDKQQNKSGFSDILSHLVDPDRRKSTDPRVDQRSLTSDVELAILAGSDTSSSALGSSVFLLGTHPEKLALLQEELRDKELTNKCLVGCKILEGVINEALRLFPPVPSGMTRCTPQEGMMIAGKWIPGDVDVWTPTYTIFRDERCFMKPYEFIPERWSSQPELVRRKDAFVPFSTGAYNCAGKQLAMMELRLMLVLLVKTFDIRVENNQAIELFTNKPRHRDIFGVDSPGPPLNVILTQGDTV
ncbi:cytochrome P450 [Heliocybe sulcata]|uniref:Cytochrome P450 n=1 Tax=Heliocybe sulcata TaxID=5364 RepID=A0A5C3N543_9AGAM|nr:cytochrome P450 [Heliocybe sulcata]